MTDAPDEPYKCEGLSILRSAWLGRMRLIRMLIEGGTPVDTANSEGHTALSVCCMSTYIDEQSTPRAKLISYLLQNGANPNLQDVQGRTPMMFLIKYNCDSSYLRISMRLLLEFGSDPLIRDNSNKHSLSYASDTGNMRIVMALANSLKSNGNKVLVIIMEQECRHCDGICCIKQPTQVPPVSRFASRATLTCVTPEEVIAEMEPLRFQNASSRNASRLRRHLSASDPDVSINRETETRRRGPRVLKRNQSMQPIPVQGGIDRQNQEGKKIERCGSETDISLGATSSTEYRSDEVVEPYQ